MRWPARGRNRPRRRGQNVTSYVRSDLRLRRRAVHCLPFVAERAKLDGLAVAEGVDVRNTAFPPLRFVLESHSYIDQHNDSVPGNDEPSWFATARGPRRALVRPLAAAGRFR